MKPRPAQLSLLHKLTFFGAGALLFVSGASWAWANAYDEASPVAERLREIKPWLLKIHGFSALAFALILGTLLAGHVLTAWRARKNRRIGGLFFAACGLLTLSGYALYYIGGEELRSAVGRFHLWLGLVAPLLLAWHIWSGRGQRPLRSGAG